MKTYLLLLTTFFTYYSFGQASSPNNISAPPAEYLGFSGAGTPEDLFIRNGFNLPIRFETNGTQRLKVSTNFN